MLEEIVATIDQLESGIADTDEFLEMAEMDDDEETYHIVLKDLAKLQKTLEKLEFK